MLTDLNRYKHRLFNLSVSRSFPKIVTMCRRAILSIFAASCITLSACGGDTNAPTDTPNSGTVTISVDETYKPVIEQQLQVFDSSFPDAHINVQYKSEADCIKDYLA